MASIRRTLSPYNERSNFPNGSNGNGSSYAPQSPSHKLFSHGRTSLSPLRRFLASMTFQRQYYRKSSYNNVSSWRRSVFRCSIFFFLGFLLGMAPFSNEDFNELKHPIEMGTVGPPVVRSVVEKSHDDVVVNAVELGVVDRLPTNIMELDDLGIFPKKQLIVVTPTYNRSLQAYYLNRLGQVLRLIRPPVLWIVVEMNSASVETSEILRNMGVVYRHLVCKKNMTDVKDRGVHQRNTALEHIEKHRLDGIVYFADDDNIYSRELFENMRDISRFGTWPVGMLAQSKNKAILEGPVCNGSRVIGWHTNEKSKRLRRFHVDMSGFAFNSTILWDPKRWHRPTSVPIRQLDTVKEGFQETTFIEQIVEDESQMEAVPQGCNRIINWHLHLEARGLAYPAGWIFPKNLHAVFPVKR